MNEKREIQHELFQDLEQPSKLRKGLLRSNAAKKLHTIILSNEQIIFVFIGLIILLVISFSLGVERGKRITSGEKQQVEKRQVQETIVSKEIQPKPEIIVEKIAPKQEIIVTAPYFIQVASYIDGKQAEEERKYLKSKGYKAEVVKSGKHFVINIIGFADKKEAEDFVIKIKDRYKDYLIRKKK